MKLNLTVIADYLTDIPILQQRLNRDTPMTLRYPADYHEPAPPAAGRLHIAASAALRVMPKCDGECAFVFLGYPPESYLQSNVEYICVPGDTDPERLWNKLLSVFDYFNDMECRMNEALFSPNPYDTLGDVLFSLFRNPLQAINAYDKFLFVKYDPNRPEYRERYESYAQTDYASEEERMVVLSDPAFSKVYQRRGAYYCAESVPVYGTAGVLYNLFDGNYSLGCVYFEIVYRQERASDYPLLEWAGGYLIKLLKQESALILEPSEDFKKMVTHLTVNHFPYQNEYDRILGRWGWMLSDSYLCICIEALHTVNSMDFLAKGAIGLRALFEQSYIFLQEQRIVHIVNLTRSRYCVETVRGKLLLFLSNNPFAAGVSCTFSDFNHLWIYYQQASIAAKRAVDSTGEGVHLFEESVLDILCENAFGQFQPEIYMSNGVRSLIAYDKKNNTELMKTLKHYLLHNQNAAQCQETLHIARATCVYRIRRVEEISGLDLSDNSTVLYLSLLFRLLSDDYFP